MRAVRLSIVVCLALALNACGEAPTAATASTPAEASAAAAAAAAPAAADLDTQALRQRASEALAVNRLFAPAGNNAVEDYLALRERLPGDLAVDTALLDLAPYVVIGAEQAKAVAQFDEAQRLIDLLQRMDADAPAAPRLQEGLAAVRLAAEAQAEVDRLAAEATAQRQAVAQREAATQSPATLPVSPPPAPTPQATAPAARPTPAAPTLAAAPAPPPATPAPTAARTLLAQAAPRFPEQAQRRRLEGSVQLQLQVAADGSVLAAEVLSSTHAVFEREAVLAARRWRFAPAASASTERIAIAFRQSEG